MWMFSVLGLLLVYLAIGAGIACLIARYYGKPPWDYLGNNNTWLWVLAGGTAVTFVIALFNFGPALLLPEKLPTPEQRGTLGDFFAHLLHGTNAPAKSVPTTTPLPWATGTWFWWKAFFVFLLLTPAYACFALSDEVSNMVKKVGEIMRRHREAVQPQTHTQGTTSTPAKLGFWQFFKWDLMIEIGQAIIKSFIRKGGI